MKYKFSKEMFLKNAPKNIKTKLQYLLDDFEGLEVNFSEDDKYGTVTVNLYGVGHQLYPVYKEWCIKEEQLKLI